MPTEEDLAILRALHDAAERSALELRESTNLSVPVLVARLKALAGLGYITTAGPTMGASEETQIGYVLTVKGKEAIGRTP